MRIDDRPWESRAKAVEHSSGELSMGSIGRNSTCPGAMCQLGGVLNHQGVDVLVEILLYPEGIDRVSEESRCKPYLILVLSKVDRAKEIVGAAIREIMLDGSKDLGVFALDIDPLRIARLTMRGEVESPVESAKELGADRFSK